ncbi:coproporphyrinogen dehydrogenase HemZ [Selenomonadales bacterium OttesenSCG-928-I06]|nr:coproporphyrinogen dehydrogenase HemZ [Selenomonadales bacterium OttesenSCG-928-I06]
MDTAKNVKKNLKINRYFLVNKEPLFSDAVNDIMALFKISAAADFLIDNCDNNKLNYGDILIENSYITENNRTNLKTKVCFLNENEDFSYKEIITPTNFREDDKIAVIKKLVKLNILTLIKEITGINPSPWGILRGVRPTKIVHKLLDENKNKEDISQILIDKYSVASDKADLISNIAVHQRNITSLTNDAENSRVVSVYIGIPYCPSRCLYCSFPSYTIPEQQEQLDSFLDALNKDIIDAARLIKEKDFIVESVYIGGGTPTSLNNTDFHNLINLVKENLIGNKTKEFTVEAGRPDSITTEKLETLNKLGVTRISINPQTMQDKTLNIIGRNHSAQEIVEVINKIRQITNFNVIINMDVIVGLPGETEKDLIDTMTKISALKPENITIHTLAIKNNSILKDNLNENALPNIETTIKMLETAKNYAEKLNMVPYYLYRQKNMTGNLENIGYAIPGTESFYNIKIIEERQSIIGIGPAAGTKAVNFENWSLESCYNPKDIFTYINNLEYYLKRRKNLFDLLFKN